MRKLLIIDKHQFGYLTDTYKWCEHLKDLFKITIVTISDGQKKKINMDGIRIIEVTSNIKYIRGLFFMLLSLYNICVFRGKTIVIYFNGCKLFKMILPWKRIILDIRTLSVSKNDYKRKKFDDKLKRTIRSYDFITIISDGIRNKLNIPSSKSSILPLGSDVLSSKKKEYDYMKLLYVGTLCNRNIHETIIGLARFNKLFPNIKISYDIAGTGDSNEINEILHLIEEYRMHDIVTFHGFIPYTELNFLFDKCNIGISYVPCTDYYDNQPPTKTFEYILSGLFCIATATFSNKEIINNSNGILIDSTPDSFTKSLITVCNNITRLDEKSIRDSLKNYEWNDLIINYLIPVLSK